MRVELVIDRAKKLSEGPLTALEKEFSKCPEGRLSECSLNIRCAGSDGLSVYGGKNNDKKGVGQTFQATWECADDWFY